MLSAMAMEDIADLELEGIHLKPQDIVTLNELGLRVERSATAGDVIAAPRIGWAGDIPIYEPTIQSEMWVDDYAQRWFAGDAYTITACMLYACAYAQTQGFFTRPEMRDKTAVISAIKTWHESLPVTQDQLRAALTFALWGSDAGSDIYPVPASTETETKGDADTQPSDIRTLIIDEAVASGLGLSMADMQLISESRLIGLLRRQRISQGTQTKETNCKAHADYARTLLAIKTRLLEAKQNG